MHNFNDFFVYHAFQAVRTRKRISDAMLVSELLADNSLHLELATPSSEEILASPIKSVVSTESLSPTGFLEPDTLLLTTGQSMRFENEQIWLAYAERLKAAEVSAVAFSVGTVHPELPRNLSKAATKVGLPILAVPPDVSSLQLQQSINRSLAAGTLLAQPTCLVRSHTLYIRSHTPRGNR